MEKQNLSRKLTIAVAVCITSCSGPIVTGLAMGTGYLKTSAKHLTLVGTSNLARKAFHLS
jgi:hypothetical protein